MSRLIPRGVAVAGLGRRFFAAVIDIAPIGLIYALLFFGLRMTVSPAIQLVIVIGASVLGAGYCLYQWWAYATRGAGLGARATGLRLVSLKDGEPVGWWRFFLRQVVFAALMGTVVGGIALLIFLVVHERRQGWHDMVAGAVVVEPKHVEARPVAQPRKTPTVSTVGLPPHLASSFSPQPGTSSSWAPEAQSVEPPAAPDWLPGVPTEPVAPASTQHWPQSQAQQPPAQQPQSQPWQPQAPWGGPAASDPVPPQASSPAMPSAPPSTQLSAQTQFPLPLPPKQNWIPIPSASSVVEPSRKVKVRPRDFGEVDDDEGTRIANLPRAEGRSDGAEGWYVRLDDGREVELTVTVLLGRNPRKTADDPEEVHLVPASGDGRMISRTHVLIGTDPRGVFVIDRGSTNGTALVVTGGELEPCPPSTQVRVREGQQVSYGNRWFTVLRRPPPLVEPRRASVEPGPSVG
ncbi:Uncharacterized membrane protein YckC, RDD family [Tessaracoccus bendigoensis DSM 12906]|uniref:Uncharacterized membrane protein YckC, RDD family n=1 Tax=Tessaracoccus bendigoensis DSM 12906 TaxID=1123357 RepID=A0A1M6J3A2_9ACTN|nr:RDD family protein [Tessaracoccus bendigoensis]SHJ41168.1 Uncharacterized membrane protein YckC, RDD family [Tessaracoccus bendigoensis DSM 12906]